MWIDHPQRVVAQACVCVFNIRPGQGGLTITDDLLLDAANCLDAPEWMPAGSTKQQLDAFGARALTTIFERSPA